MSPATTPIELLLLGRVLAARPHVLSVRGTERVNELYRFDVRLALDAADDLVGDDELLEMPIQVQLNAETFLGAFTA